MPFFWILLVVTSCAGGGGGQAPGGDATRVVAQIGPAGAESQAKDVNNLGAVVGDWSPAAARTARQASFLWARGLTVDLGARAARAVNDHGDVVGDTQGVAYIWRAGGSSAALAYGSAHGVNNNGWVVGEASTTGGHLHAFVWTGEDTADLGTLGGSWSGAYGINDAGEIVGWAETQAGQIHAFFSMNGTMADLGTLGGNRSMAYAINDSGQIVGYAATPAGEDHAFLVDPRARMIDLGTLGSYSVAYDIDSHGRVVGESGTQKGDTHSFLGHNGKMIDLNDLVPPETGWELTRAFAINDSGQIVGEGLYSGERRAFILTFEPVLSAGAAQR